MIAVSLREGDDIVKLLLGKGADVNETSKSDSHKMDLTLTILQITMVKSVNIQSLPWF